MKLGHALNDAGRAAHEQLDADRRMALGLIAESSGGGRAGLPGEVGTTSTFMDCSGGPCRSLRIASAYILAGTWPSGGTSPNS